MNAHTQIAAAPLHPATARLAACKRWTADPAVSDLFAILRKLSAIGETLGELRAARPDLGVDDVDVGTVTGIYERAPQFQFAMGYRVRANGGACANLWSVLDNHRSAWIHAKLEAEGLRGKHTEAADDRFMALDEAAPTVEQAYLAAATKARSAGL